MAVPKTSSQSSTPALSIKVETSEQYHQIRFSWNRVSGATNYGIAVYLAGKWRVQTSSIPASQTYYLTPKNLTPGKSYKVAIAAKVNGQWNSSTAIKNAVIVTVK
jgi:ribosomal protein S30